MWLLLDNIQPIKGPNMQWSRRDTWIAMMLSSALFLTIVAIGIATALE
jgi:hypothetical protein